MTQFIVFTCDAEVGTGAVCGRRVWTRADALHTATRSAYDAGWSVRESLSGPLETYCPTHHDYEPPLPSNVTPIRKR